MKVKYLLPNPKYFQVYRGDTDGAADDTKTISVNTGLVIFCEPRTTPFSGSGYTESIVDLYNPDVACVDRLRQELINPQDVMVERTGKLFLKIDTGGSVGNITQGLFDFGTGVGSQEHPDYHFGTSPGPPEQHAAILSKRYSPTFQVEANYVFQEEYPESIPEEDEESARNIDSTEIEFGSAVVTSVTHILIAEITVTEQAMTIRQRHWGPLVWYSPIIRYGDFDYREHS